MIMDISELKEILSRGEDSKTQFKTKFTHVDSLASEICAMANTDGGIIVVGVSDRGEITEFWIKIGADKRRATREELRRLMQASHSMYADELPVLNTSLTDLNISYFKDFFEKEYGLKPEEDPFQLEQVLESLKLITNGRLTLAGLLLFGNRPERIRPQFIVKAVAFVGNDVSVNEYLDSENLEGGLYEQYRNTMAFLESNSSFLCR